jgi:HAD superfamily phosphatase (TIGR01668 family)
MKKYIKKRKFSFLPDYLVNYIYEIDFSHLSSKGIENCFFDLDHTIVHQGSLEVSDDIVQTLKKSNMNIYIATNRVSVEKLLPISKQIGAKGIMHAQKGLIAKPRKIYYQKAVDMTGNSLDKSIMIGDRLLQDTWGANRTGLATVLVGKLGPVKGIDKFISLPEKIISYMFRKLYYKI